MRARRFDTSEIDAIEHAAQDWIESGITDDTSTGRLCLSEMMYLGRGGASLYWEGGLNPEFCVVRRVLCGGADIGYAFFSLNQNTNVQLGEIAIRSANLSSQNGMVVYLPHPYDTVMNDALTHHQHELDRCAIIVARFPKRQIVNCSKGDAVEMIASRSPELTLSYLASLDAAPTVAHEAVLRERWHESSHRQRVGDVFYLYGAAFFKCVGNTRSLALSTLDGEWPLEAPSFPSRSDGKEQDFDLKTTNGCFALQNFLTNLPFHTRIFALSTAQERLVEDSLTLLGQHDGSWPYETRTDSWVGLVARGSVTYGAGAVKIGSSWLHLVNVSGGVQVGEKVYTDVHFRAPLGTVSALLTKSRNHLGYFRPEEQRGMGLVISK